MQEETNVELEGTQPVEEVEATEETAECVDCAEVEPSTETGAESRGAVEDGQDPATE